MTTEFEEAAEIFATMTAVTDAFADLVNNSEHKQLGGKVVLVVSADDCQRCADGVEAALQTYNKFEAKYGKNLRN